MGKKAKEHRAKVARRNKRIAEQKSKIQTSKIITIINLF